MYWQTTHFQIDLRRPRVMGIVNVTPDSFSDGGCHDTSVQALRHCEQLLRDGADVLDIGGESTRPGAAPLNLQDELARVVPVVRGAVKLGVPVSVDTYKPQVMQAVLDLGADIINDVWALRWQDGGNALTGAQVVARHPNCGVCLMHMHLQPQTMQVQPMQGDVVPQVLSFLKHTAHDLKGLGVEKSRVVLDPGIGFGKTVAQNFSLLARQAELLVAGYPLLIGWSRKSSLAGMTLHASQGEALSAQQRLVPSVAAALLAAERGAAVLRVHDVKETVQALQVLAAITSAPTPHNNTAG
ncbi:MAG: dihydropteroate synthase [Rhodoferax sp.]|nr:dihydropteroate synthase [Rhodoferax sp.]OIP18481.1 MAG: dihydropteroate synthase [Comamonadaceae bacterium CG2_30_59_20]PIW07521.1 MAG: dihydropteroate synthase [Comamonadaceae bacterium CG17_big_fil_post_rev_8_21_14_2_50_60_13]PIY23368.1 MAG: dihydropteroate synthase [Comamonadaceae bacterium CG_4_10_14_3_um_filter_60_75]PJC12191.1 MAG: dihydropteroate synthase [Comamonadaceae bacterium CG_4_9_14_0_8_um_filter_60_18]